MTRNFIKHGNSLADTWILLHSQPEEAYLTLTGSINRRNIQSTHRSNTNSHLVLDYISNLITSHAAIRNL